MTVEDHISQANEDAERIYTNDYEKNTYKACYLMKYCTWLCDSDIERLLGLNMMFIGTLRRRMAKDRKNFNRQYFPY